MNTSIPTRPVREIEIISENYVRIPDHAGAAIANKINDAVRSIEKANTDLRHHSDKLARNLAKGENPMYATWIAGPALKIAEAAAELQSLMQIARLLLTDEEIEAAAGPADCFFTASVKS